MIRPQKVSRSVTPAKAGVHNYLKLLDSRFRGNDENGRLLTFYELINIQTKPLLLSHIGLCFFIQALSDFGDPFLIKGFGCLYKGIPFSIGQKGYRHPLTLHELDGLGDLHGIVEFILQYV